MSLESTDASPLELPSQVPASAKAGESEAPVAAPSPAPPRYLERIGPEVALRAWQTRAFGRLWPRAGWIERGFWGLMALGGAFCLWLAGFYLHPDPSGMGTHQQLGLPPCGFVEMFDGVPCPSCGYTTTFTLAAHGRPLDAFMNQPFGFVVFLVTLGGLPLATVSAARGLSLFGLTDRWPWGRIFALTFGLWIACWLYKWALVAHAHAT